MDNTNKSSSESFDHSTESPGPEVLKPRVDDGTPADEATASSQPLATNEKANRLRHRTYRPSHRATFIGLAAVVLILAINAGILAFVLESKGKSSNLAAGQVSISSAALSKIGVNSSTIGNSGIELMVNPNAQFNGKLTVAGDVSIAGQLKLNSTFVASNANLTQLQAGNTTLSQLNVNENSTLSSLNLRNNLAVTGTTQLQGAVTIGQLLTVNNNLTVIGNLAVGGGLSANSFSAHSLTSTSTLTIDGHVITGGLTPAVGPGPALGSNGTVAINGNDSAGLISINFGVGSGPGTLVNLAFRTQYGSVPHVVITPVGAVGSGCSFYVLNLSVGGFGVGVNGCTLPTFGDYGVDYIVEQ
jgi:cytoskeletal protein CcmA (bactofilin family)